MINLSSKTLAHLELCAGEVLGHGGELLQAVPHCVAQLAVLLHLPGVDLGDSHHYCLHHHHHINIIVIITLRI